MQLPARLIAALLAMSVLIHGGAYAEPAAMGGAAGLTAGSSAKPLIRYPATRALDLVEDHFGVKVRDPYRWLEQDVRRDKAVEDWVAAENRVTRSYLDKLPGRDLLRKRMAKLFDYGRFSTPRKAAGLYFYTYNSGLQNQSPLYVRQGLHGEQRLLLDPNALADDGTTALAEWEPAPNGRLLLYATQDAGTDWRTLHMLDVATGRTFHENIPWVKFSSLSWDARSEGFFYSRFEAPAPGEAFQSASRGQKVWYHRVGTPAAQDRMVYETPDRPELNHRARVTDDGQWLVITSSRGTEARQEITLIALNGFLAGGPVKTRPLVRGLQNEWRFVGSRGDTMWFVTNLDAPNSRLVTLDAKRSRRRPAEIVAQRAQTLSGASMIGSRIVIAYLADTRTYAELVEMDGRRVGDVPLPGIGTAAGFAGKGGDPETFFSFSGFTMPSTVYRYDTGTGTIEIFAQPRLAFDPEAFVTVQLTYPSKDGTMIPMTIIRRRDIAISGRTAPTLLYGYGGFNISLNPGFSATRLAWLEQGGAVAIANLRGGGEFGQSWHDAGRLQNKQNVFDDFIAAGEYLKANGYTGKDQLAVEGRSNGGLLVGAVVNQRPDLFAAALPSVGVMDMLRFDKFTVGRFWIDDYGDPGKAEDFPLLYSYSPYHNILPGKDYPAILVTTGDTDDRVVPAHSFKYAAALQAADIGSKPHLIRVETRTGHGSGKPVDKVIDEYSDIYAFAAYWTGLKISDPD
ncbi:S9 family peptidase [Sphingobium phenoxybenzoativorans]|uniref:prolyl oligopeptidase n=1 Tax=Sphingobium phenoxybenzoativorans TaxID=1592790 RepID=A0A975K474_9SPHN|nr:prolyl oligopeptidase family serine peptidase [Sphingobium phenoxybenzoativorans]QUT04535.1 S9 family peptidase [Sphingobium phenoxybenzoativorans]